MELKVKPNTLVIKELENVISKHRHKIVFTEQRIDTIAEFSTRVRPDKDISVVGAASNYRIIDLEDSSLRKAIELLGADKCTNAFIYPPSTILDWHTNSNDPGIRTYYTYSIKQSIFKYIDPDTGATVLDEDHIGRWTCRSFLITAEKPLWHTVWSEGVRFAFGFSTYLR
jgi:hypothetical protein